MPSPAAKLHGNAVSTHAILATVICHNIFAYLGHISFCFCLRHLVPTCSCNSILIDIVHLQELHQKPWRIWMVSVSYHCAVGNATPLSLAQPSAGHNASDQPSTEVNDQLLPLLRRIERDHRIAQQGVSPCSPLLSTFESLVLIILRLWYNEAVTLDSPFCTVRIGNQLSIHGAGQDTWNPKCPFFSCPSIVSSIQDGLPFDDILSDFGMPCYDILLVQLFCFICFMKPVGSVRITFWSTH